MERLNINRLKHIRKGYLNQKDLADFMGVGKRKAKFVYDDIVNEIESEGKKVDILGIPAVRAMEYIGLSEDDIRRFAEDERKEECLNVS